MEISFSTSSFVKYFGSDLYKRSDKIEQSFSERQIYEQALSRLADEYAVIYGMPSDDAVAKIEAIMEKEDKKQQSKRQETKKEDDFEEDDE